MKNLIQKFLNYFETERNRSRKTLENYTRYLDRFSQWASKKKISSPQAISLALIKEYRAYLRNLKGRASLKKNTQNYHLIALRSFLKYLSRQGIKILPAEKVELSRTPPRKIRILESEDIETLLRAPAKSKDDEMIKKRDKAILECLSFTGMHVAELTSLKRNDINLSKNEFVLRGKKRAYRVITIPERTRVALKAYLELRTDSLPPLFIRNDHAFDKTQSTKKASCALTPRSIQRLVQRYGKLAGLQSVTPHILRHSYAVHLLKRGSDVCAVQSLLGHAQIASTKVYLRQS